MAADTWLLMKLYWKLDRREVVGQSPWRILAYIVAGLGLLFVGAGAAAVGYFSSFLVRPDSPFLVPPGLIPGLMLTIVLLGVLVTGLNQAVKSLFLSGDLDRLMVAPVRTKSVMIAKLLGRLPASLILLLFVAAPAVVAYGIGLGAGPVYYLLGLLLLLLAPLFGLAVGAIIAMLLVRVLPVNRLSELLTAAYALFGIGIALLAQLPRLFIQDDPEQMFNSAPLTAFNSTIERVAGLPLPTLWAGRGLVALDAGRFDGSGLLGIAAYVLITLGLFALVVLSADKLYLSGWLKTQSAGGKRRGLGRSGGYAGIGSPAMAIGSKDWMLRLRDPRQLVNLLGSGLVAVIAGGLALFRGGGNNDGLMTLAAQGGPPPSGPVALFAALFSPGVLVAGFAFFVGYMFFTNAASYALALEGVSFPLLKATPIRPREVWSAKLLSTFLPFAAVFALALAVSWVFVRFSLLWLPYALVMGLLCGLGLLAINVSAGFRYANLGWTDPRRMMSSGGGLVALLVSLLYGVPAVIVALLGFGLTAIWPGWAIVTAGVAVLLLALYTWAWYVWMSRWGERAWNMLPV